MNKKIFLNKCYNILKKIKGCTTCHNILGIGSKFFPYLINKKKIFLYNKLKDFKNFKKYNFNMNNIIYNLKNKYLLEISKYFFYIKIIKKLIVIKTNV